MRCLLAFSNKCRGTHYLAAFRDSFFVVGKKTWPACEHLENNHARARSTPPKLNRKATKSGRLRRPLCVRVFRVLEGWNSLAHDCSRSFCKMLTNSFRRQYRPTRQITRSNEKHAWTDSCERKHAEGKTCASLVQSVNCIMYHVRAMSPQGSTPAPYARHTYLTLQ